MLSAEKGIDTGSSSLVSVPEDLPTSLSYNEWHNIALEILCDGTNKTNIYIALKNIRLK